MQAIIETVFDVCYLTFVIAIGLLMMKKSEKGSQYFLFGIMAVTLGCGDAFHLVPRMIALNTTGLENFVFQLGLGKAITSVTMTIFYVILYYVWVKRYDIHNKQLTFGVYFLAIARIVLCLFPQNDWFVAGGNMTWAILRNIPFALMGILIIVLFMQQVKKTNDKNFRYMALTIILSFGFYIPVVLWVDIIPLVGMLMIPKTCAYVWSVVIGYNAMKKEGK